MEMKCIFNNGKNISILAKVTQVSDVVHGPLVFPKKLEKNEPDEMVDKSYSLCCHH
jgi:hypothetical protein